MIHAPHAIEGPHVHTAAPCTRRARTDDRRRDTALPCTSIAAKRSLWSYATAMTKESWPSLSSASVHANGDCQGYCFMGIAASWSMGDPIVRPTRLLAAGKRSRFAIIFCGFLCRHWCGLQRKGRFGISLWQLLHVYRAEERVGLLPPKIGSG